MCVCNSILSASWYDWNRTSSTPICGRKGFRRISLCVDKGSLTSNAKTTANTCGLNNNLLTFQLVPKNPDGIFVLSGEDLLKNMSTYANQHVEGDEGVRGPTPALDIHISKHQMECIWLTDDDLRKGRIIVDAGGQGAILRIAKQKLDSLVCIRGHCGLLNDLDRMTIVENML